MSHLCACPSSGMWASAEGLLRGGTGPLWGPGRSRKGLSPECSPLGPLLLREHPPPPPQPQSLGHVLRARESEVQSEGEKRTRNRALPRAESEVRPRSGPSDAQWTLCWAGAGPPGRAAGGGGRGSSFEAAFRERSLGRRARGLRPGRHPRAPASGPRGRGGWRRAAAAP